MKTKFAIDPAPRFDTSKLPRGVRFFRQTSDDFFDHLNPDEMFDLAFVDGLHTFEQTYRDVINTLSHIPAGPILIDDTVPDNELTAIPNQEEAMARVAERGLPTSDRWHGDVWKVVAALDRFHPELEFRTIRAEDNCQTLLWRRQAGGPIAAPSAEDLAEVAALEYPDVFSARIPEFFLPVSEGDALATCLGTIADRFGN